MAMTPIEMIDSLGTRFENSQNGIIIGKQKGEFHLVSVNYWQSFKCRVMQGLISWRIKTGSPVQYFSDAINVANTAIEDLMSLGSENISDDFFIEIASSIAFLINKPFEFPQYSLEGEEFYRLLNFELAKSLMGKHNKDEWDNILNNLKPNKRINLCIQTYKIYSQLLFNKDVNKTNDLVKHAEDLFLKRKNDSFYSGGEGIEGGGLYNDVTVDYRLAAILKFIAYDGESIHKWIWD